MMQYDKSVRFLRISGVVLLACASLFLTTCGGTTAPSNGGLAATESPLGGGPTNMPEMMGTEETMGEGGMMEFEETAAAAPTVAPAETMAPAETAAPAPTAAPTKTMAPAETAAPAGGGETAQTLATSGEQVFARQCASCHGQQGQGVTGPALIGANARLSNYKTAEGLYNFVHAAMPQTAPGSLTDQQYLEVVTYLLLQNNDVQPDTEISADQLGQISLQ